MSFGWNMMSCFHRERHPKKCVPKRQYFPNKWTLVYDAIVDSKQIFIPLCFLENTSVFAFLVGDCIGKKIHIKICHYLYRVESFDTCEAPVMISYTIIQWKPCTFVYYLEILRKVDNKGLFVKRIWEHKSNSLPSKHVSDNFQAVW